MKRLALYLSLPLFLGAVGAAWLTQGTGTVRNDPERNISVPSQLTVPLQVQAAYNGTDMSFRYRWPAPNAGIFPDMLR